MLINSWFCDFFDFVPNSVMRVEWGNFDSYDFIQKMISESRC